MNGRNPPTVRPIFVRVNPGISWRVWMTFRRFVVVTVEPNGFDVLRFQLALANIENFLCFTVATAIETNSLVQRHLCAALVS
jgi:hypothetical protein